MRQLFVLIFLLALLAATPWALHAQEGEAPADSAGVEAPPEEEPTDLMRAQGYLNTVTAEIDSIGVYLKKFHRAEDEERQLLRVSAERHLEILEANQTQLFKLLPTLDPADSETQELNQEAAAFLVDKYELYEETVKWRAQEIDILREQRIDTPPEGLNDLESRIGEARGILDSLLQGLRKIIEQYEALGQDATQTWQLYDRALHNRAENLVGRLQISVNNRDALKKKIETSKRAGAPEAEIGSERTRLEYAEARVKGVAGSLSATTDLLGDRGYDTAPYRQFIIRTTGEISDKVLDPRVMLGLIKDGFKDLGRWFRDQGPTILVKLLIILATVICTRLAFRIVWWLLRLTGMIKLTKLMVHLGNSLLAPVATIFGLFLGLWLIGANPTTLLTGAGVAGVIIGFALQDSLSNLAAGFFILATRPFDLEDVICTGGQVGTVKAMWIANTTIVTFDGRRLLIPNRKVWADIIENRSAEPLRRTDITVRVGFGEDIDRAIGILKDLLQNEERVLDDPAPAVFVSEWADSWVEIAVRPWTKNENWWGLLMDLQRLTVQRFAAEGIEIPYPRREVTGPAGPEPQG